MKMKKAKKPNSVVQNDIPPKNVKEFVPELSKPLQIIFNSITTRPRGLEGDLTTRS